MGGAQGDGGVVCVVIPAHDSAATVHAAITSALASDAVGQCVVVDDASADGTASVAEAAANGDPRFELVVRDARGGPCAARNDGLRQVRCRRAVFLDADDELCDGGVELLAAAMDQERSAVAALGRFRAVDDHGRPVDVGRWATDQLAPVVRRRGEVVQSPAGVVPEALVTRLVSPPPGAWLLDAAAVRAVGGFDARARRSEDLELLVRLAAVGRVVTVDHDVLLYRRHGAQRSAAVTKRRWGRGYTLWLMLRAAPGRAPRRALARGMVAYHLELFDTRRSGPTLSTRARGVRNLAAAATLAAMGVVGSLLPRRLLAPLDGPADGSVD